MANLYVRDLKTNEVVYTVELHDPVTQRSMERTMMGMLINMNTERYVIDDDEAQKAADEWKSKHANS